MNSFSQIITEPLHSHQKIKRKEVKIFIEQASILNKTKILKESRKFRKNYNNKYYMKSSFIEAEIKEAKRYHKPKFSIYSPTKLLHHLKKNNFVEEKSFSKIITTTNKKYRERNDNFLGCFIKKDCECNIF